VFNYATGGATSVPQFDINGDDKVNSGDLVGGMPVAGVSISGYASNVVGLRGGGTGGHAYLSYTPPCGIGKVCPGGGPPPPAPPGPCGGGIGCPAQAVTQGRGAWQELRQ